MSYTPSVAPGAGGDSWRSAPLPRSQDIAAAEKVSDRFVSWMMQLAYLSPDVLEYLVIRRVPPPLSLNDLAAVAERPRAEAQGARGCSTDPEPCLKSSREACLKGCGGERYMRIERRAQFESLRLAREVPEP
ncbi:MAG: phage-like protein [Xanthobacteraceae bacterium]|nr:MAG: phage-like protein [Xanthobacteraceae bacterium]